MKSSIHHADNRLIFQSLDSNSIDLILTDPPYKDYQSNRPKVNPKQKKINESDFNLNFFLTESARVLKNGAHIYCWCDHNTFPHIILEMKRLQTEAKKKRSINYFSYKNCLIWVKSKHGSGDLKGDYAPQHEFVIFAVKGHVTKARKLNGKRKPNVFFKGTASNATFFSTVAHKTFNHGTVKPVDILEIMIAKSTFEGEIVLDPFAGTMSTAEACINLNRRYIMVEMDETHFKNGEQRIADVKARAVNNV